MSYYFSRSFDWDFNSAVERATEALKAEGFGVLADIDVQAKMEEKVGPFRPYRILGACHPPSAYEGLRLEPNLGIMMPCNVVVQQHEDGKVEISAMNPAEALAGVLNPALQEMATDVSARLKRVIDSL